MFNHPTGLAYLNFGLSLIQQWFRPGHVWCSLPYKISSTLSSSPSKTTRETMLLCRLASVEKAPSKSLLLRADSGLKNCIICGSIARSIKCCVNTG